MINNAYRYALVRVRLAAKIENGMLEIAIEDDGSGYPPSILLGDAGEQARLSFAGDSSGRGLYFAIVAARAHFRADVHAASLRRMKAFIGAVDSLSCCLDANASAPRVDTRCFRVKRAERASRRGRCRCRVALSARPADC